MKTLRFKIVGTGLCLAVTGLLLLPAATTFAGDGSTQTNSVLVPFVIKVKEVLHEICPEADVHFGGRILSADYRTQNFMIHTVGMDGEISQKPHEEVGPGVRGFCFSISTVSNSYPEQGFCPRTFKAPYWSGYYDRVRVRGTDQDLILVIKYGSRTDTNIVERLKACIYQTASNHK